jgi:TolB-like protein/class 3 adenylate cyclase
MAEERLQRRLAAILSADVVGYSRLMGFDEAGTLSRLNTLRRELIDPTIAAHSGRIVKLMGDGALAEFASAVDAVTCAIEIQRLVREGDAADSDGNSIQFRIGVNVGDVIIQGDDILGDGVNIAARVEGVAEPGGIAISEDTWRQIQGKVPGNFIDTGEQTLKNIPRPVRVYALDLTPKLAAAVEVKGPPALATKPSIAVLAFNNMSGDPEQEYFSDGISEDIITDLSKLSELHVIARNSTFTYKGKPVDVKRVGRELGVHYVVEGSVRKAGNRIRVTGQLVDTATGAHLWADRFDRELNDIFAVQDELTQEIIAALKVKLTPEQKCRLVRKSTITVEAYNFFLRGREQAMIQTKSNNIEARALLESAIAISPGFAAPHAYIAFTRLTDYLIFGDLHSLQAGLQIAAQAIAMGEDDPYPHFVHSIALVAYREYDKALAEVQRCLALAPNLAEGHMQLANVYYYSGDPSRAVDTLNAYMRLDPFYPPLALHFLAQAQHSLGQFDAAVTTLKRRLEREPSENGYALLASCYGHLGEIDESRSAWAEVMRIAPDFLVERRWGVMPFKNPHEYARRVEGLRKAGLPV